MSSEKFQDYSSGKSNQSKNNSNNNSPNRVTNLKAMLVIVFIIFIIVLFFIIYINQYVKLSRKNIMVEKLEDKKRKLESKKEHLQLKIAELKSLDRVERIAKEELNMKQPDNINYIVIDSTKKATKVTSKKKNTEKI